MLTDREKLIDLLIAADESAQKRGITDYKEAIADNADFLLKHGVIVLPPNVKPVIRVVREQICNQYALTKTTRIQWNERTILASEEEAEQLSDKLIYDWHRTYVSHQPTKALDTAPPNCSTSVQKPK